MPGKKIDMKHTDDEGACEMKNQAAKDDPPAMQLTTVQCEAPSHRPREGCATPLSSHRQTFQPNQRCQGEATSKATGEVATETGGRALIMSVGREHVWTKGIFLFFLCAAPFCLSHFEIVHLLPLLLSLLL